jgi:hypothetical protein
MNCIISEALNSMPFFANFAAISNIQILVKKKQNMQNIDQLAQWKPTRIMTIGRWIWDLLIEKIKNIKQLDDIRSVVLDYQGSKLLGIKSSLARPINPKKWRKIHFIVFSTDGKNG